MKKIVVAMTGASGAVYGVRLLSYLHTRKDVETHFICSKWARTVMSDAGISINDALEAADYVYKEDNLAAAIASGSFHHDGMVIVPCSMKTLASVACGLSEGLIGRAADVTIKERRPLVLVVRETPLSPIHLENMLKLSRIGVTVMPPVPGLYSGETTIAEMVDTFNGRLLNQLGIENGLYKPWKGVQ